MNARSRGLVLVATLVALLLSGCGFSVDKMPLPGGPDLGDDPIELTVMVPDALDLVPQSTVKLADVNVGKVTDIELVDQEARITIRVRRDAKLPANSTAEIRQTSLLGEKFLSLNLPAQPSGELLADGDTIATASDNRNPEVEEVLGALSLVLNGGGVAQLKTITVELDKVLGGDDPDLRSSRSANVKSVLTQLESFMGDLDESKGDIVNAIEALNQLSITANNQMADITLALDKLPEAVASLDSQREDLVKMLASLEELSDVGVRVIDASKDVTIEALTQLQPVLTELAKSGDDFANAFSVFLTYPFVDESIGRDPQVARNLHMGDYVNLAIKLDIHTNDLLTPFLGFPDGTDPVAAVGDLLACITSAGENSDACEGILNYPGNLLAIGDLCDDDLYRNQPVCQVVSGLFGGLGLSDGLPGTSSGQSGAQPPASGQATPKPSAPTNPIEKLVEDLGLLGLPGLKLNRTAPGGPAIQGTASVAELAKVYNPSLVYLLVPGVAQ
ncbi:MCE family protein [Nocardioides sp. AE5]|uniref:MCE family protein n=1 Tax=Nocardioides sp. AE5 TaxID=2962573 RepID=UPI002880C47C|nr:MCE family protein [Nocardioides sp. AE5]MDT0200757.1 MCE family protein [Nocardioides sp. AE5]